MMQQCIAILQQAAHLPNTICQEAADTVTQSLTTDPSLDVHLEAIHLVCDLAYQQTLRTSTISTVSLSLLNAVGSRRSAKHKRE
jgi:hypothetical protein